MPHFCPNCGDPISNKKTPNKISNTARLCDRCYANRVSVGLGRSFSGYSGSGVSGRHDAWDWFAVDQAAPEQPTRPDLAGVPVENLVVCPSCGELNIPRLRCFICNRALL